MEKSSAHLKERSNSGDMAVEGLLAGIAAGMVMLVYLLVVGLSSGEAIGVVLGRFSIQVPANPLQGALLHLAVSAVYGLVFGILLVPLESRFSIWGLALLYALAIYSLARFVLLPDSASRLLEIAPLHFALAHLVYGLVLGFWFKGK